MTWYFIDSETGIIEKDNIKLELNAQKFILGGIMDEKEIYKDFENSNEMKEYMINKIKTNMKYGRTSYFYAHNMTYDFYSIFNKDLIKSPLIKFEDGFEIKYLCFYPFMAQYGRNEDGKFQTYAWFLDTMGFFRGSLKEMGESIGVKKGETPLEGCTMDELKLYQKQDCFILKEFMSNFKGITKELNIKTKSFLTIGQVALNGFISYCDNNNLSQYFMSKGRIYKGRYVNELKPAFRGGRTECLEMGNFDNCIKIDINSLYAWVMVNMEFPNVFSEFKSEGEACKGHLEKIGIIKCRIKSPKEDKLLFGYLPIRYLNEVYFPLNCILEGTWTTLEINKAISLGYEVIEWKEGIFYKTSEINPLKEYVQMGWDLRKKSEGIKRKIIKNILVSLYGKFGQQREDEDLKVIKRNEFEKYQKEGWDFVKTIENDYLIGKKGKSYYVNKSNPIISLWITALGRDRLYDEMMKLGKKVKYVATDALIFQDEEFFKQKDKSKYLYSKYNLNIGDELGEFKIEGYGKYESYGENQYLLGEEIKMGGIPKKDITLDILRGNKKFTTTKIIGIKEAMLNPIRSKEIGSFRSEERQIIPSGKSQVVIPKEIIEKQEKIYYGF